MGPNSYFVTAVMVSSSSTGQFLNRLYFTTQYVINFPFKGSVTRDLIGANLLSEERS